MAYQLPPDFVPPVRDVVMDRPITFTLYSDRKYYETFGFRRENAIRLYNYFQPFMHERRQNALSFCNENRFHLFLDFCKAGCPER